MATHASQRALDPQRAEPERPARRRFLNAMSAGALLLSGGVMGLFNLVFLRPRVTYGPPSKLRVGRPPSYASGSQVTFADAKLVVRREGDRFSAIGTVCTHLGCTVTATEVGFDCPCHGSSYDQQGAVVAGPAPRALPWYRVTVAPNGELEVDKNQRVEAGTCLELSREGSA
jgi:cytochrome b6-f complex iron-sulfur subunit